MTVGAGPTVEQTKLVQVLSETTFGTDETGSLGSFTAVPVQEGTAVFTLDRQTQNHMAMLQHVHGHQEEVLGRKSATLKFTIALAPTGTASASGVAAVQGALGLILKAVMGGQDLGTGSTFSSGWTATSGDVGSGTGFSKGTAVGWVNTSNVYEMRPLKNVSSNTLTTKLAFSSTPANSNVAYSCATYYLTSDPAESLQFVVRGLESQDEFVLLGGQLDTMTFSTPLDGTIPTIAFGFKFASWMYGADAAGSASLTDITPTAITNFDPIVGHAGRLLVQTNGTTTYSASALPTVNASAITIAPSIPYIPVPSPSGVEGIYRWHITRNGQPRVSGSFSTFFEDTTLFSARDSKLAKLIWYQIGLTAGSSVAIEIPTAQFTNVQRVDSGGISGVMVEFKGRNDGDISSASGDQDLSPLRIHLG